MVTKVYLLAMVVAITLNLGHGKLIQNNDFFNDNLDKLDFDGKPTDHAKVARQVVHKSSWTSFGTISSQKSIVGFPMVNVISVADSKAGDPSTGHIYFYLANLDFTTNDIMRYNKATLLYSADQDMSCSQQNIDSMEPTCARIMISGKVVKLVNGTEEYEFGQQAFASRHPAVENWLRTNEFYLCTLEIAQIMAVDWYGWPHIVPVKDYYQSSNETSSTVSDQFDNELNTNNVEPFEAAHPKPRHHIKIKINPRRDEIDIEL